MAGLKGSKTEQNLKDAFAGESQANRRYLYFAQKADVEGYNDVAAVFRSTAEGETGHAHGSSISKRPAIRRPASRSAPRRTTSRPRLRARPTNTPTCIRAWRGPRARKASTRSPIGSRPWRRPSGATRAASPRRSTSSTDRGIAARIGRTRACVRPTPPRTGAPTVKVADSCLRVGPRGSCALTAARQDWTER